jgi:hypothetical protein
MTTRFNPLSRDGHPRVEPLYELSSTIQDAALLGGHVRAAVASRGLASLNAKLLVNGRLKVDVKNVSDSQQLNEDVGDLLPGDREVGLRTSMPPCRDATPWRKSLSRPHAPTNASDG